MKCIFCEIASKSIKAYIVYEDDISMAFLDINPVSKGHILLIPKKHYTKLSEMPEDELERFIRSFKKVLKLVEEKLSKNYNVIINTGKLAGQEIEHLHIHIIPRYGSETVFLWNTHKLTEEEAIDILNKLK